jgi:acyl carrier protein
MAAEETFGIKISDEEASAITTPGEFADCVLRLVARTGKSAPCFSQSRFYQIRTALINAFGEPRERIRPRTPLRDFIRNEHTRADWQAFRQALQAEGLNLPKLQHARWVNVADTAAVLGIPAVGVMLLIFLQIHPALIVGAFFVLLILTGVLLDRIPEGKYIPAQFQTVASLIPYIGSSTKPDVQTVWTRESVLATIFLLTHEQLGVPMENISEHSHFYDDLGMDQ